MPTTISGDAGCSQVQAGSIQFDDVSAGMMIGFANYTTGAYLTAVGTIPDDNTIPQITEGIACFSLAYTAKKANSKLKIEVVLNASNGTTTNQVVALFKDSGANAIAVSGGYVVGTNYVVLSLIWFVDAIDTLSHTFSVRTGAGAGTSSINGNTAKYGGSLASSITITEIAQ